MKIHKYIEIKQHAPYKQMDQKKKNLETNEVGDTTYQTYEMQQNQLEDRSW